MKKYLKLSFLIIIKQNYKKFVYDLRFGKDMEGKDKISQNFVCIWKSEGFTYTKKKEKSCLLFLAKHARCDGCQ